MPGRQWNPQDIPDSLLFPEGAWEFEIEDIQETQSRQTNKAMMVVTERCATAPWAGLTYTERYVLGTDDDPDAADPETLKRTGVGLKRLLTKARVELSADLDDDCQRALGQHVILVMGQRTQPDMNSDGTPNSFAGRVENYVTGTFSLGEVEIGDGASRPASRAAVAKPAARQPAAPTRSVAPARPAAPTPAAPARPAARPVAPAAPAARAPAPKREPMLKCSLCNDNAPHVRKSDFAKHVGLHEQNRIDPDTGGELAEPAEE